MTAADVISETGRDFIRDIVEADRGSGAGLENHIDVVGGSGRAYRFSRLRDGFPLSPVGGAYLLARGIFATNARSVDRRLHALADRLQALARSTAGARALPSSAG